MYSAPSALFLLFPVFLCLLLSSLRNHHLRGSFLSSSDHRDRASRIQNGSSGVRPGRNGKRGYSCGLENSVLQTREDSFFFATVFQLDFSKRMSTIPVRLCMQCLHVSLVRLFILFERKFVALFALVRFRRCFMCVHLVEFFEPLRRELRLNVPHDGIEELLACRDREGWCCVLFIHSPYYTSNSILNQGLYNM